MRRNQLEQAIRTACQIIGTPAVIVVGSHSILGTFREDQLPAEATMSAEIVILPIADSNDETARLADIIEGVAGELSSVEALHGFSIDGVDLNTSALPVGWRNRLVLVRKANTAAPDGEPQYKGWCLEKPPSTMRWMLLRRPEPPCVSSGTGRGHSLVCPKYSMTDWPAPLGHNARYPRVRLRRFPATSECRFSILASRAKAACAPTAAPLVRLWHQHANQR
jgi:hypothetical protein